ncbi:MAG: inositol monophosphatase [Bacteroidales bacterium]|jgi:myo-inositol-1(or 4)-monophosphatase|nr:inositol monophosphatase [Bacteroidales bacterium]
MKDLKTIVNKVAEIALETGKFIKQEAKGFDISRTETKGLHDLVSYVDKKSEEMLVQKLGLTLPEAGFITEEGTSSKKCGKYCWVIDPLDGTTNFVHGLPPYAISIGLLEDDEPVAGVVYEASGSEIFTAWKNGGAWLNGKAIHVSDTTKLSDSLIATGFPYNDFGRLDEFLESLKHFSKTTHGIRRLGSAAIDMAYVACGRFETFYEYGLNPWDIAAATIIVREAGGKVSDFRGNEKNLSGSDIIASNNLLYSEFLETVNKFMNR